MLSPKQRRANRIYAAVKSRERAIGKMGDRLRDFKKDLDYVLEDRNSEFEELEKLKRLPNIKAY